jgi:hypothetical protein
MNPVLTVAEVATRARKHPDTVRLALADGELHGTQRVPRGKWTVRESCADAWIDGLRCPHAATNVTPIRRSA